jgi:hypothetical protein
MLSREDGGETACGARLICRAVAPSPTQLAWRARIERVLRLAAPGLDLLLAVGDRASRLVDREPPGAVLPAPGVSPIAPARPARPRRAVGRGPADELR